MLYKLINNNHFNVSLTDIDECNDGVDGCNQICHNAIGSYACSCDRSYSLSEDGNTCYGEKDRERDDYLTRR